jgi:hypothetical protein
VLYPDALDINRDWLRSRSWYLPRDPELFLRVIGGPERLEHFMTLPAAIPMPPELRKALTSMGLHLADVPFNEALHPRGGKNPGWFRTKFAFRTKTHDGHFLDEVMKRIIDNGESTAGIYGTHDGPYRYNYGVERSLFHKLIAHKPFIGKHPVVGRAPIAVIAMGGSASGKSSVIQSLEGVITPEMVKIDVDKNREQLPEFEVLAEPNRPRLNAISGAATHTEASMIGGVQRKEAVEKNYDVFFDVTGNSEPGKLKALFALPHDAGYEVKARYVYIPVEEAVRRAEIRAQQVGRGVNPINIRELTKGVAENVELAINTPWLDFEAYSNEVPFGEPAILIATKAPFGELVIAPGMEEKWKEIGIYGGWWKRFGRFRMGPKPDELVGDEYEDDEYWDEEDEEDRVSATDDTEEGEGIQLGRCFEYGIERMIALHMSGEDKGAVLVHGKVHVGASLHLQGNDTMLEVPWWTDHGWIVRSDGMVEDWQGLVRGLYPQMNEEDFNEKMQVKNSHRYTWDEVRKEVTRTKHSGPWHKPDWMTE